MFFSNIVFTFLLHILAASSTMLHGPVPSLVSSQKVLDDAPRFMVASFFLLGIGSLCYFHKRSLWQALLDQDFERVKSTVYWGANINCRNHADLTPLHFTINYELLEIMRFLLHKNAQIDVYDYANRTPLDYALKEYNDSALLCLLFHNAIAYNKQSSFLSDKKNKIFDLFELYRSSKKKLLDVILSQEIENIEYKEKKYDAIGFALINGDHKGIDECMTKKIFSLEDIVFAIADNQQLIKFLSYYFDHESMPVFKLKELCLHAKKQGNEKFIHGLKKYVLLKNGLLQSQFTQANERKIIQHVLSYINFDL